MRLLILFVLLQMTWAQEFRMAHVDSKIIFGEFPQLQQAQLEYESQLAIWEQKANVLQKELNDIRDRLEKQALILSNEKKGELERTFASKETELKEFIAKIYGPEGEMVKENHRISQPLIQKVRDAINQVALEEGYDMVLDRASGALLFWKEEQDLTKKVIKVLSGQ